MSEESRPLAGLPSADRTLLKFAPLQLAVAEIRLGSEDVEVSAELGLRFKDRLKELGIGFARLEPLQQQTFTLNVQAGVAPAPRVDSQSRGWMLHSADGTTQVSLLPQALVLQTSKYHRWSETMRPPLEAVLTAASELRTLSLVVRIGLRYVNRFNDPEARSTQAWIGRLDETFLGPLCHPNLGSHVRAAQQQVELGFSDTQGAVLRHGPFPDVSLGGAVNYLLDIDVYDNEPIRFDPDDIVERIEVLNRTAATLFQAVLKPEYLRELQGTNDLAPAEGATP